MDPNYEDLALLRTREAGSGPPTRRRRGRRERGDHRGRRQVATVLRRVANRLDQ